MEAADGAPSRRAHAIQTVLTPVGSLGGRKQRGPPARVVSAVTAPPPKAPAHRSGERPMRGVGGDMEVTSTSSGR